MRLDEVYVGKARWVHRLVIMGQQLTIDAAIKKGDIALNRKVGLGSLMTQAAQAMPKLSFQGQGELGYSQGLF